MKVLRAALIAAVVVNLALLAASAPLRATLLRYEMARKQQELRKLALENRTLLHQAALARSPERVAARAASFGLELRSAEPEAVVSAAGVAPAPRKPGALAPRR